MRIVLTALLAIALAACSAPSMQPDVAPAPVATEAGVIDTAQACVAAGGEWRALGRLQREQCVIAYADAGKTCSNRSDCEGQCLAIGEVTAGSPAAGTCQRDASQTFGCRQRVDGGVAQPVLCVD